MADVKQNCSTGSTSFKEAVCVDAGRVYDSCCDRDCMSDMRVYFTCEDQALVNNSVSTKIRSAEVLDCNIDVEQVTFNRGYYACDLTFFFLVTCDIYSAPHTCPATVKGICFYSKKAILYGSEGNVKTFTNEYFSDDNCGRPSSLGGNNPKCVVQCVDPVALSARISQSHCEPNLPGFVPASAAAALGGTMATDNATSVVLATLGLFTIVQLVRNVQMLVPVYDFCIPEKQCNNTSDSPCDVFNRISFPTSDFFPPRPCELDPDCGCSSENN